MADVGEGEAAGGEPLHQRLGAARRAALEEGGPLPGLEQVDADDTLGALVAEVNRLRAAHAAES